ncbi:hypothetical protein JR316_0010563 [Psilocybe cubensis]|uniref:WD40 repeat-like protein n=2 Tax=Psilocybe cubensis TaxID=181762 RepID=A0A8H7XXH5_PSICU|nr:hypothetical protein JR316_0010563 [Psilocybe cubensis]KAH9476650.1 hypothetical protein JR316_0010563 [Psilocybe cubensis]
MNTSALTLPVVTIQHTFAEVIQEIQDGVIASENFWVSCYKKSETSVHAKINAELDEHNRNLVNLTTIEEKGDVEVSVGPTGNYRVTCKSLGIPPTEVVTPIQEYKDEERSNSTRPHRITAFDVSPDCSRYATGYLDGTIFLYPTTPFKPPHKSFLPDTIETTKTKQQSRPHVAQTTSLKFFPSSRVLLSSGLDFTLTILPADLPDPSAQAPSYGARISPARTMRAHTRMITDTAIIAVGRNVVSSSLDATIKLWDVSSGDVISSITAQGGVSSMSLGDRPPAPPDGEEPTPPIATDAREVPETSAKVIFGGLENGSFQMFDLGFKKSVYTSPKPSVRSSLSSIVYLQSANLLATGSSSGLISIYDTRSLATPLTSFRRLDTTVEQMAFRNSLNGEVQLAVATSDGLPYIASVVPEGPSVLTELIGVDCDSVRNVTVRGTDVWCASDDGIVRRYAL